MKAVKGRDRFWLNIGLCLFLWLPVAGYTDDIGMIKAVSPDYRMALLELYTSDEHASTAPTSRPASAG